MPAHGTYWLAWDVESVVVLRKQIDRLAGERTGAMIALDAQHPGVHRPDGTPEVNRRITCTSPSPGSVATAKPNPKKKSSSRKDLIWSVEG